MTCDHTSARIEPLGDGDLPLLERLVGDAICRRLGLQPVGAVDFEYPPGTTMRCNDWRLDLAAPG